MDLKTGVTLSVSQLGPETGVPLVVIHGGPSWSHHYLLPGLRLIAERRCVYAPDLRGCGKSSTGLAIEMYQPELAVQDVVELVTKLGFDQVDLLGFSTGGQWAQLFIESRPDLVRRLILASTTAYSDFYDELSQNPEYQTRRDQLASMPDSMPEMTSDYQATVAWAKNGAPLSIWELSKTGPYLQLLDQTIFTGDWMAPFQRGLLHSHRPADPERVLNDFKKPILILHGQHDFTFPVSVAQRLHAAVPLSELVILDHCGHQAQFEAPDAWASAIVTFLA